MMYRVRIVSRETTALPITTLTSREFSQDTRRAKNAAARGPVFITDSGRATHVLLSIREFRRLTQGKHGIIDRLGLPEGVEDIALGIPLLSELLRPPDFSGCFYSVKTSETSGR